MNMSNGRDEPRWIPEEIVSDIHDREIERFGGLHGLRSPEGLASALARPLNRHFYEGEKSVFRLAAVYADGIIRSHPYVDGNKRTGYALARAFLALNGFDIRAADDEKFNAVLAFATREMSEDDFADWLQLRARPR